MRRPGKKKEISGFPAIIRIFGSLYFAVFLIATLAVILILSTSLESVYGTPFAQKIFYNAGWFDIFLGLLGINIFCSAVLRYPYKRKHTGFLMTHAGILILLVGSLMSRLWGVDGQMTLYEGEKKDGILLNTYELVLHDPSHNIHRFDLKTRAGQSKHRLYGSSDGSLKLFLHRATSSAVVRSDIENIPDAPVNHAAKLTLTSQMAGQNETLWLVENNPLDENSNSVRMGPALIELKEKPKEEKKSSENGQTVKTPTLRLHKEGAELDIRIDLQNIQKNDIPLGKSGLSVSNLTYYPDARVKDNELVSVSDKPQNPAVEFDVHDASGATERYVYFALFPEFESMHGKNTKKSFGLRTELEIPSMPETERKGPSLEIYYSPDGLWSYGSRSSKSSSNGTIEQGKTYSTGWMDFKFSVEKLLDRAAISEHVEEAPAGAKGQIAAEISLEENGKKVFKNWVTENLPKTLETAGGPLILALRPKNAALPFTLELKDFRKVDYPGTQQAQSYESDVSLFDPKENITIGKTIRMNKPLDYAGYRIFQSSYIQNNGEEASVFTVAKNPGIALIYGGSCVIFLGIFLVFFVPPFSSLIKEEK